jgi:hypothetical protein
MHGKIRPIFAILLLLVLPVSLTAQIASIPSVAVASGSAVGGAASLTTVGAIPYVTSAGVLGQDATALFWDATNDRLGVGTASPATLAHIKSGTSGISPPNVPDTPSQLLVEHSANASITILSPTANAGTLNFGSPADGRAAGIGRVPNSAALYFYVGDMTERARFAAATGNLLIGGTTDGNYRLDVQTKGSTGAFRVWDQTATTGSTLAVIQAGAGQSGNLLSVRNNAGTELVQVDGSGAVTTEAIYGKTIRNSPSGVGFQFHDGAYSTAGGYFQSNFPLVWNSDTGIYRNAAGILEIDSGVAGTYRDLILRRIQTAAQTVSQLPAAAAGNAGSEQYVTDATATTIGSVVAGGGANKVKVWSDGTNWKIYAN